MAPKQPAKKAPKVRRRKDGTFRKGVSGNPGGRPGGLAEFRELMRDLTPEALKALGAAMKDRRTSVRAAAVKAATEALAFAWGKPAQSLELTGKGGAPLGAVPDLSRLTDEELAQMERLALKATGGDPSPVGDPGGAGPAQPR